MTGRTVGLLILVFSSGVNGLGTAAMNPACHRAIRNIGDNPNQWSTAPELATQVKGILAASNRPLDARLKEAYQHFADHMLEQIPKADADRIKADLAKPQPFRETSTEVSGHAISEYEDEDLSTGKPQRNPNAIVLALPRALWGTPVELIIKVHELQHLIQNLRPLDEGRPINHTDAKERYPIAYELATERDAIGMEWEILQLMPEEMIQTVLNQIARSGIDHPESLNAAFRNRHLPKAKFIEVVLKARKRSRWHLIWDRVRGRP